MAHVRAVVLLLVLTVVVVCGLYPLSLWLVGRVVFPDKAEGSLIVVDGKVRGSRLLAQDFQAAKYFKPRPSAVGYNAAGSGGSNLAASNPLLRDRVARQLGPMVHFTAVGKKRGPRVGPEVQRWFVERPGYLATWAKANPTLAQRWVKDDDNKKAVIAWLEGQPALLDAWRGKQKPPPDTIDFDKALDDLAVPFFERFTELNPNHWPVPVKDKHPDGTPRDRLEAHKVTLVKKGEAGLRDLQGVMFDPWLADTNRGAEIEKVPADLVMASGSGLDPHITFRGAHDHQLDDVVAARVDETGLSESEVRQRVVAVLEKHAFRPLGFLGEPLVNVVEVNLELDSVLPPK
jgi:K+-transporting ATPase ATPase C chain